MLVCGVPENSGQFARVLEVEHELFGNLSLPSEMARTIYKFRPEVYAAIFAPDGHVAAYSSAYPLKKQYAEAMIAGEISEPDLTLDMLLGRHDDHEGASVYIGTVAAADRYDPLMKTVLIASLLSWRVSQLRDASIRNLSVIMMPVTKEGERLARYTGAKKVSDGGDRASGYPIYGRRVTPGFLFRATAAVERCLNSKLVWMNFNFRQPHEDVRNAAAPVPAFGLSA